MLEGHSCQKVYSHYDSVGKARRRFVVNYGVVSVVPLNVSADVASLPPTGPPTPESLYILQPPTVIEMDRVVLLTLSKFVRFIMLVVKFVEVLLSLRRSMNMT